MFKHTGHKIPMQTSANDTKYTNGHIGIEMCSKWFH